MFTTTFILFVLYPSYHEIIINYKVKLAIQEFKNIFMTAKSAAVLQNQTVYLHTVGFTDTNAFTDNWCVIATTEPTVNSCTTNNNTLYIVDGTNITNFNIKRHKDYATIKLDPIRGWPNLKLGKMEIDWITLDNNLPITIKIIKFGKIMICNVNSKNYDAKYC